MSSGVSREMPHPLVLVVEDEAMIRMLLVDELEGAGQKVVEAENADVAVEILLGNSDVGIVVTDIRMPGSMDGMGLAAWMREHRPSVPIVITSGFATMPDIDAVNPAIARIIGKPYRTNAVADCLVALGFQGLNRVTD